NERETDCAATAVQGARKIRQQSLGNKFAQSLRRAALRPSEEQNQKRNREQSPKPVWRAEGHGNFFQIVCDNKSWAMSKPHPAMMQAGKRSRYSWYFFTITVVFSILSMS